MTIYCAVAYWSARQEDSFSCARRLKRFLSEIEFLNENLKHWRKLGSSVVRAKQNPQLKYDSLEELEKIVAAGVNRRDVDKSVIEELGFHVSAWNGGSSKKAAGFSMLCGMYSNNKNLSNCMKLDLPDEFNMNDFNNQIILIQKFFDCWEPDSIKIFRRSLDPGNVINNSDKVIFLKKGYENQYAIERCIKELKNSEGTIYFFD